MDLLEFIESDAKKIKFHTGVSLSLSLVLGVAPLILGLGLREDLVGLASGPILLSSGFMALFLAASGWLAFSPTASSVRYRRAFIGIFFAMVFLSFCRSGFPFGTEYASWGEFWFEVRKCFVKGLISGLIVSLAMGGLCAKFVPMFNQRMRLAFALLGGVSGVFMLNIHCPSSHIGHLLLGHWLEAFVIFGAAYGVLSILFHGKMREVLGPRVRSLKNLRNLS